MQHAVFFDVSERIRLEIGRSIVLHGDWLDLTPETMIGHIRAELDEAEEARQRGDVSGEHGIINELTQVGATVFKAIAAIESVTRQ